MTARRHVTRPAPSGAVRFDERLSVPWWWWPPAFIVVGLVDISMRLGHPTIPSWLPTLILLPLVVVGLVRLGRRRVTLVEDESGERELRVAGARLPVRYIAEATALPAQDKQIALGPELDPSAYLFHRPWIGPLVRVTLNDPADPTPYWLFSARRSEALVQCLRTSLPG